MDCRRLSIHTWITDGDCLHFGTPFQLARPPQTGRKDIKSFQDLRKHPSKGNEESGSKLNPSAMTYVNRINRMPSPDTAAEATGGAH
jgi:hypothetical protein